MTDLKVNHVSAASATLLLLSGFLASVGLRVVIGGPGVAQSVAAGLVFAACLTGLGLAAHVRLSISRKAWAIGIAGGLALCVPAIIAHLTGVPAHASSAMFLPWAVVVTLVAIAEEYFLRGALFDAADRWLGKVAAVVIGAAAFAALHVPLYGWHIVPLDFAVGLWLGALRVVSRTWTSPAIAHTLADLLSWWLR